VPTVVEVKIFRIIIVVDIELIYFAALLKSVKNKGKVVPVL
jgi:hypothetical protein